MRVLLTTYADRSVLLSMVPLAWALRAAGHDVRVASTPAFTRVITDAGLLAVPVGRDDGFSRLLRPEQASAVTGLLPPYDAAVLSDDALDMESMRSGYETAVRWWHKMANFPLISGLVDFARYWRPDLVLWEPTTYAGSVAAAASGAVHGRVLWSIDVFGVTRARFSALCPTGGADPLGEWLAAYATRYGIEFDETLVTGMFTVDTLPESMRMTAPGLRYLPMQYVPYGGRAVVPDWLRTPPKRPRVAVTLGITAVSRFGSYNLKVQEILDSLADLDIDVVAAIAESEQRALTRVPSNTTVVSYVPLQALAPTCSVVVHHGGPGTLLTTARHAVPQLVLPWEFDAPELARRFARRGAGIALDTSTMTTSDVRANVLRLLEEPSFTHGAARLRDEMLRAPTPLELVGTLEAVAAHGPRPVVRS
ncbi:activator-dependent family glycosyltransferase [Saccharomonospora glauca]|uniref:Glycosyl transferase, UDP-glucuronosyltransferase n=1 Tax=Saccharomonospora glauca K62 TaxID=928724 RepID=I1D216_9PSEU|nr:activator-dependent family glycosyltransferase [Saccharomonospora glauca]EIE98990.1 glycosyl transferase, UDP-glucuronosyltransferase [Saccharomonospora glauca K62]